MDILNDLIITVFTQRVLNQIIKGFLLAFCRERDERAAKHVFYELRLQFFRLLGKIKHGMDIGITVVEGREQKALGRRVNNPVTNPVFNIVGFRVVEKARL